MKKFKEEWKEFWYGFWHYGGWQIALKYAAIGFIVGYWIIPILNKLAN